MPNWRVPTPSSGRIRRTVFSRDRKFRAQEDSLAVIAVALLAVTLTGCGGDENGSASSARHRSEADGKGNRTSWSRSKPPRSSNSGNSGDSRIAARWGLVMLWATGAPQRNHRGTLVEGGAFERAERSQVRYQFDELLSS